MKNNKSQQKCEHFFSQLLLLPPTNEKWLDEKRKAQTYYREHFSNSSTTVVKEKLRWINTIEGTHVYEADEVAERLVHIESFEERVQRGDETLVVDVARAFASRGKESVTWTQFQNALHFLALHAPEKYTEVNAFVKALLEEALSETNPLKKYLTNIPFEKVYHVYQLVKALYDAIIEVSGKQQVTYDTIYNKFRNYGNATITVITHPEVLSAIGNLMQDGIDTIIKIYAPLIGSSLPTREILRQLGRLIGKYLNPYLREIHQKQLNKYSQHN